MNECHLDTAVNAPKTWKQIDSLKMTLIRYSGKECACQYRKCGFDPWVRKMKEMATHFSILAWEIPQEPGHRSLAGYGPWGQKKKKLDMT